MSNKKRQNRFTRGWAKLKEIDGEAGERVIESLKDIAPDPGQYTIELLYGRKLITASLIQVLQFSLQPEDVC